MWDRPRPAAARPLAENGSQLNVPGPNRTNDREVVVMSETMKAGRGRAGLSGLPLLLIMSSMAGCASMTQDVD